MQRFFLWQAVKGSPFFEKKTFNSCSVIYSLKKKTLLNTIQLQAANFAMNLTPIGV